MSQLYEHNLAQIVIALTCPINRHAVRVKYGWNDYDLYKHPDVLVLHFIQSGGAEKFTEEERKEKANEQ